MARFPTERQLRLWRAAIQERGIAILKLRILLKGFGQKRRGPLTISRIREWLEANGIFPSNLDSPDLNSIIQLRGVPGYRIGDLVDREEELQSRFEEELMGGLGLKKPRHQHRSRGTWDKMDFLCIDRLGRSVVVELKRDTGKRQAVEQVLRYIGHLKHEGGHKDPWGILITGSKDPDIQRALQGLGNNAQIIWYLYGVVEGRLVLNRCKVPMPPVG